MSPYREPTLTPPPRRAWWRRPAHLVNRALWWLTGMLYGGVLVVLLPFHTLMEFLLEHGDKSARPFRQLDRVINSDVAQPNAETPDDPE